MGQYLVLNGPMQTTAAFAAVSSGTAIKTLLQVKPFNLAKIIEWGISFDGNTAAVPVKVELIETDVAATVTASVDADITKRGPAIGDMAAASVAGLTLGTSATGYTASAEGSITAVRNLDPPIFLPPTAPFVKQIPLAQEGIIQIGKFARIRITAAVAVSCYCYMLLEI